MKFSQEKFFSPKKFTHILLLSSTKTKRRYKAQNVKKREKSILETLIFRALRM